jgi:hypothetical protein
MLTGAYGTGDNCASLSVFGKTKPEINTRQQINTRKSN